MNFPKHDERILYILETVGFNFCVGAMFVFVFVPVHFFSFSEHTHFDYEFSLIKENMIVI